MNLFGPKKDREDLDANYYERQKAYLKGREDERLKIAQQRGIEEAHRIANKKPFYKKVLNAGQAIGRDLIQASGNVNPDVFFNDGSTGTKKRKGKRRKKRNNPYPLI